ncbi:hypothetical protein ABKV19_021197 [Rosa sericea]
MVYYNELEMIAYLPEDRGGISLQKLDIACQFIEAIQVAIHDRPCEVIKIGYSNGGFRARYKIDKGKFDKRAKRFKNHMGCMKFTDICSEKNTFSICKIADLTETNLYLSGCNLAVTGRSALGSSVGFLVVEDCKSGAY